MRTRNGFLKNSYERRIKIQNSVSCACVSTFIDGREEILFFIILILLVFA